MPIHRAFKASPKYSQILGEKIEALTKQLKEYQQEKTRVDREIYRDCRALQSKLNIPPLDIEYPYGNTVEPYDIYAEDQLTN